VALLTLIRWKNLTIVALLMYLSRWFIVQPIFQRLDSADFVLGEFQFFLFVLTACCVTAAGFIINDIIDYPIDLINKPNDLIISRQISVPDAKAIMIGILILGAGLTLYLAYVRNNWALSLLYPAAFLGLFLYSKVIKALPLSGNVLVALFCSAVGLLVLLAELTPINSMDSSLRQLLKGVFIYYAVIAFFATLFREIVKDIEDIEGDEAEDYKTLPIVLGIAKTKFIAGIILLLFTLAVGYGLMRFPLMNNFTGTGYVVVFMALPVVYAFYQLFISEDKKDYMRLSRTAKVIMLSGILFLPVFSMIYFPELINQALIQ